MVVKKIRGIHMYDDAGLAAFVQLRLKELMILHDVSIYHFCKITGVPKSTIYSYLDGRAVPSIYFIGNFCKYMHISQNEFYQTYDVKDMVKEEVLCLRDILQTDAKFSVIKHLCTKKLLNRT